MIERVFIPLFATFIGAFMAFRYQYAIEKRRDKRAVVQQLMMYRNVGADELDWIKHMNVIDIVFHDNEIVRQLFDHYMDWVSTDEKFHTHNHVRVYYEMLYLMCQDCGYSQITEYDLKRNVYSPNALRDHYNRPHSFVFVQGAQTKEIAILLDEISQHGIA
ncbi:MAG: DUF6680 family protein [Chitinophagaceae bacterium]